ncbi:metallophosphoesterase family protein [Paucibacter sp. XJ19-41]|uniref:metallophosphoesterase family protein n=1 Tax=Paucibacter sp. XJ19-41 TaxID=2927824 RepID=UPI002349BB2B|nr:metallophosphoesterase [Paucibacter sp. XJ19-41]MDC6166024.1 metallophosphoesterase [Paucibacter sp. XJ19-41]
METPRLALRFRDPGIDTISEHKQILEKEGAVWWGWWKKDAESPGQTVILKLHESGAKTVLLVNRHARKNYTAKCLRVEGDADNVDTLRIPAYYRDKAKRIPAWLLLGEIIESPYDDAIGNSFQEGTILSLLPDDESTNTLPSTTRAERIKRSSLLHISDLHFGDDYGFPTAENPPKIGDIRKRLPECLLRDLKRIKRDQDIAGILATGDFTTRGDWSDKTMGTILRELNDLARDLGISSENIFIAPGNHDIVRYAAGAGPDIESLIDKQIDLKHERDYRFFRYKLNKTAIDEPLNRNQELLLEDFTIQICTLNSCALVSTKWTEYGYIGEFGAQLLEELGRKSTEAPTYRILALHHHLMPVSRVDTPNTDGVSLTLDAIQILDSADQAGVHLAIHGHQHTPRLAHYKNIASNGEAPHSGVYIVAGGSTGAHEKRRAGSERNSYSVLTFKSNGIQLCSRELRTDAKEGATIFDTVLDVKPLIKNQ